MTYVRIGSSSFDFHLRLRLLVCYDFTSQGWFLYIWGKSLFIVCSYLFRKVLNLLSFCKSSKFLTIVTWGISGAFSFHFGKVQAVWTAVRFLCLILCLFIKWAFCFTIIIAVELECCFAQALMNLSFSSYFFNQSSSFSALKISYLMTCLSVLPWDFYFTLIF